MELFLKLFELAFADGHWVITFGPILWAALVFLSPYGKIHLAENTADRKIYVGRLIQNKWRDRYDAALTRGLDAIDAVLAQDTDNPPTTPARIAWSPNLFWALAALAFLYPVASSLVQWIAGSAIMFGNTPVIAAGTGQERTLLAIVMLSIGILLTFSRLSTSWLRQPSLLLPGMVVFGMSFFSEHLGLSGNITLALIFVMLPLYAIVITSVFAGAGSIAFALAFAFAGAVEGWGTLFLAVMMPFAGAGVILYLAARNQSLTTMILLYLASLMLSGVLILNFPTDHNPARQSLVLVLFGLFPLMNTLADFASVGLTRYLLRKGLDGLPWWQAVLDLCGGALIFLALGCFAITYFHLVHFADGTAVIDIPTLFAGLKSHPSDYWWLGIMLLTTLLPTVLHAIIAWGTIGLQQPIWVRQPIVNLLSSDLAGLRWWGMLAYTGLMTLAAWTVVGLVYVLATLNHSAVIQAIIAIFEIYAKLIGAV